jgi:hypothetical protein
MCDNKALICSPFSARDPESVICPNTGVEATKEDALEMLNYFLEHITNSGTNFQFWFILFKEFYLSVFYPRVLQELGVLYKNDGTIF